MCLLAACVAIIGIFSVDTIEANDNSPNIIKCSNCGLSGYETKGYYKVTIQIEGLQANNGVTCYCEKCGNLWWESI